MIVRSLLGASIAALAACQGAELASSDLEVSGGHGHHPDGGEATLEECQKLIGTTTVPVENVRDLVPEEFVIIGEEEGTANVVISIYSCESATVGDDSRPTVTSQVGVQIVSPDGTGTVNTYSLWYNTTNRRLERVVDSVGATSQVVKHQRLEETVNEEGLVESLAVVGRPFRSPFEVEAVGTGLIVPSFDFVSNWWEVTDEGLAKIAFEVPEIALGICTGEIRVRRRTELAEILGGTSAPLDGLCFQAPFDFADVTVTVSE